MVWTIRQAWDKIQDAANSPRAVQARQDMFNAAMTAGDQLSSGIAQGATEIGELLSHVPSDLNVARHFVAFMEEKLAAKGGGWVAVFAYTQDAIWAVCRFVRGRFSSAIAGGIDGYRRAIEEGKMGRVRVDRAVLEEPLAKEVAEEDVGLSRQPSSGLESVAGKTGKEGAVTAKVLNFMRAMQEQVNK